MEADPWSRLLRDYYDWEADAGTSYEEMYLSPDPFERYEHRFRLECALRLVGKMDGLSVLDVGCAEAYVSRSLARPSNTVVGVDISAKKLHKSGSVSAGGKAFLACGDAAALPFSAESFDLVICLETLEHLPDPGRALSEIRRVTTREGRAVVSVPTWTQYSWVHAAAEWLSSPGRRRGVNGAQVLRGQFDVPFEGHIWNFTHDGFARVLEDARWSIARTRAVVAFDFPGLHAIRRRFLSAALRLQRAGDRLLERWRTAARFSRYCVFELRKHEA